MTPATNVRYARSARMLTLWLGVLVLLLLTVRSSLASLHRANGSSDAPTIESGETFLVLRSAYGLHIPFHHGPVVEWAEPKRGDIILFVAPGQGYLATKRVVGIPGDRISIEASQLVVNGVRAHYTRSLQESQHGDVDLESVEGSSRSVLRGPSASALAHMDSVIVPDDHYFVLGDNREHSVDSRAFGCISRDRIRGRVVDLGSP